MNNKVLIVSFSFEQEEEAFEVLRAAGLEPVLLAEKDRIGYTEQDLLRFWKQMEEKPAGILMGADIPLGRSFAENAEGLKYVSLNCAGYDHLDLEAFRDNGVTVCNVPRQNFDAVADLTWGLIISVMRRIAEGDRNIRNGRWCDGVSRGIAVSKKTLGIIGFGAIGQAVAKRAAGFEMEVLYYARHERREAASVCHAEYVTRDEILRNADIVVLTCPLTEETHHMINKESIDSMKRSAVLINPSRGGIVDTNALYEALKAGRIAGAGLDVYEKEPLYESPLFELDNVVLTPHMGGLADREIHNVAMQAAYHMVDLMNGKAVATELSKREGDRK